MAMSTDLSPDQDAYRVTHHVHVDLGRVYDYAEF
jgi:hypothetical protein